MVNTLHRDGDQMGDFILVGVETRKELLEDMEGSMEDEDEFACLVVVLVDILGAHQGHTRTHVLHGDTHRHTMDRGILFIINKGEALERLDAFHGTFFLETSVNHLLDGSFILFKGFCQGELGVAMVIANADDVVMGVVAFDFMEYLERALSNIAGWQQGIDLFPIAKGVIFLINNLEHGHQVNKQHKIYFSYFYISLKLFSFFKIFFCPI